MRVLMLTVEFAPRIGGVASHVVGLSRALSDAGVCCLVVCPEGFGSARRHLEDEKANVQRVGVIRAQPFYTWFLRSHLRRLLRRERFDLVHVHGFRPLAASLGLGVPVVFTNHTSGFLKRLESGSKRVAKASRLFASVAGVIAPSQELADGTRQAGFAGPLAVIPNGVDGKRFAPGRTTLRQEWGIADTDVVFLLPRRLVEKNGVIWFARALGELGQGPWRAVITGDGPEAGEMRAVLSSAGLLDRCLFLGAIPNDRMPDVYRASDVAVLPSLSEATSIAGLEAMASGLPIIGTSVGGIPEIVTHGQTGLLVPPRSAEALAQAMRELLADETKRRDYGLAGRGMVDERFDWSIVAAKTVDFLRLRTNPTSNTIRPI